MVRSSSPSELMEQIQQYESDGWLTGRQAYEYTMTLQENPLVATSIAQQLQSIAEQRQQKPKSSGKSSSMKSILQHALLQSSSSGSNHNNNGNKSSHNHTTSHVSWKDRLKKKKQQQQQPPPANNNNKNNKPEPPANHSTSLSKNTTNVTICALPQLQQIIIGDIPEEQVQTWFTEMCFYARLSWKQPPCCLQCTYLQAGCDEMSSTTGHNYNTNCTRWVIWRKNTNVKMDPDNIPTNCMAIQCHSVRELVQGKEVEGWVWDGEQMVQVRSFC